MQEKIVVMGAGAVGCYFGGLLAKHGYRVTLIGRPALVGAVNSNNGLLLERQSGLETIPLEASDSATAVSDASIVLFAVKSTDTESAGRAIATYLSPDAIVLSLQNGIGNDERLGKIIGRTVIPTVVYVAAEMAGPGHMRHKGRGDLVLPEGEQSRHVAAMLKAADIPVEVSSSAEVAMWTKFIVNCCINALSAVTRQPYGHIAEQEGAQQMVRDTMNECVAVAVASGIRLPEDLWENLWGLFAAMPGQYSSTAQDMMRGRHTEIDYINGEIVRRAARLGIDVPVNNALWVMVKLAERQTDE